MTKTSQHRSIPLIYLNSDPDPKFVLNPKAIQMIKSYCSKGPMSFISICGDYRSGKSFLMNSLFFSNQGFKISPTTEPCTIGINIWSKPISYDGKNIWILDTEGFGSIARDDSYDVKIFLLTTLISNILMYNSFGALDQNSINKFATICQKSQSLDTSIGKMKMFWILRDFSLTIENKQGKVISPDQYLNNALDDNLSSSKQQRQIIKKVFIQRHCIPLVRPVIEQSILSQLNQIKFQQLRGQFVEQIYKLRKKMLSAVQNKCIQGVILNGENIVTFLQRYIDILNKNEIQTHLFSTWEKVVSYEKQKQTEKFKSVIRNQVNLQIDKLPLNAEQLTKLNAKFDRLFDEHIQEIKKSFKQQDIIKEISHNLKTYMDQLFTELKIKNKQIIAKEEKSFIKTLFENLSKHFTNNNNQASTIDGNTIHKYLQRIFKAKQDYFDKYVTVNDTSTLGQQKNSNNKCSNTLSQQSAFLFYQEFYFQQKTILPKLIGHLCEQVASTTIKSNQIRKHTKRIQHQLNILKQQNQRFKQQLKTAHKQTSKLSKNQSQTKKKLQIKQRQLQTISIKYHNQHIKYKTQYEQNIQQLKQTILNFQKDFLSIKKENQLERVGYQDKIKYLTQRNQLQNTKLQQSKISTEKAIDQIKQQYQDKIKRLDQKYQQLQNQFQVQRKRFLQLNKCKKQQENQLLQDLAQKNQKLLNLRREVVNIQHAYKQQVQIILKEQKQILQSQFYIQLDEKDHQLIVYEQKLQQYIIKNKQLEMLERQFHNLMIEQRLMKEEHQNLCEKYNEVVNKLKKNNQLDEQRQNTFQTIKQRYSRQLEDKQDLLKKFKLQLKNTQQYKQKIIQDLESKNKQQIQLITKQQNQSYQQKIKYKISQLENSFKNQKSQLLDQLKQGFSQIQTIKGQKTKFQSQIKTFNQFISKITKQIENTQKYVYQVVKKYKKLSNQKGQNQINNQSVISQMASQLQKSSLLNIENDQKHFIFLNSTTSQNILELEQSLLRILNQKKNLYQQKQDLKHDFKQTISQLQQCQAHINNLNQQIKTNQTQIKDLNQTINQLKQQKQVYNSHIQKLQPLQKQNNLLKKQVQVRDDIYTKRQQSIKQNIQLYKESINNLTEQNTHLTQRCTKLEIQLHRFADWEGDLVSNHKSKSYLGSEQFLGQNQEVDQYSFTHKIQLLQRQNRKLKKQLHNLKQSHLLTDKNGIMNMNGTNTLLTNIINDSKQNQIHQSIKKENLIYKKRIQQLRQRQLKLLDQLKQTKILQKNSFEQKIHIIRQDYEQYRKKTQQEIVLLQKKIDQLSEEKYKIKQQFLLSKQDRNAYNQHQQKQNSQSYYDEKYNILKTFSSVQEKQQRQKLIKTIEILTSENKKLQNQLNHLNSQILSIKNQTDKKVAQSQIQGQQKIRKLQIQKSKIQLQNQKNKTKYDHLLKVNSDLIHQVDTFKAKANNQLTLKQKYKNKISSLFNNDD